MCFPVPQSLIFYFSINCVIPFEVSIVFFSAWVHNSCPGLDSVAWCRKTSHNLLSDRKCYLKRQQQIKKEGQSEDSVYLKNRFMGKLFFLNDVIFRDFCFISLFCFIPLLISNLFIVSFLVR